MSGDGHTNETRELNLDEQYLGMIEDAAARARDIPGADALASIFVPALVAEVRRLRSFAMEVQGVRGVLAKDAGDDPQGQWELGHNAACRTYLDELDNALSMLN